MPVITLKVSPAPRIARWLVERGANLYRVESRRPSLESMFLEVMGQDQRPG